MTSLSNSPSKIIMLPGLDGNGFLLETFISALSAHGYTCEVIRYPVEQALGYNALQEYVMERLPNEPYILLGESFSGPLALRIASAQPVALRLVILAASFARLDIFGKFFYKSLISISSPRLLPTEFLIQLLMNGKVTPDQRYLLKQALTKIESSVLRLRAQEALAINLRPADISVQQPLLYLKAIRDRLMPKTAPDTVAPLCRDFSMREVDAPHFMLQTAPEICAAKIVQFAKSRIGCV